MSESPASVAFDDHAPAAERQAAHVELVQTHTDLSSLIPPAHIQLVIDYIEGQYDEARLAKAAQVIPFPGRPREIKRGMQSVYLDGLQIYAHGDYFDRPSPIGYESLRLMVEQVPVLSAVLMTRIRQVLRFAGPQDDTGQGFAIRHIDKGHKLTPEEHDSVRLLTKFIQHGGWEFNPRRRSALKRDNFSQFLAKLVRESLTYDAAPVETEMKRDRKAGIDGFYAIDGSTIRLCTDEGYRGDDAVFAVQVVQDQVVTAYTHDDLILQPRNPRADVRLAGYGLGEAELLVRVVTGWLNALNYNMAGFDKNAIPRGILNLVGEYSNEDLTAFRRYWNAMVKGVNNAFVLPIMASRTPESKISFERLDSGFDEMLFSKWVTFLTSIVCAVYGMSPTEINFDSFTAGTTSALAGKDTSEKLAASRDSGLRPLLAYLENLISDFIVADFSDHYVFRWTGLDEEDNQQHYQTRMAVYTVNEARASEGLTPLRGPLGEAPVNPSLIGPWMQITGVGQPAPGEDTGDGPDAEPGADSRAPKDDAPTASAPKVGPKERKIAGDFVGGLAGQALKKADPYHDSLGCFASAPGARAPQVRYEKRQLHELDDYALTHPLAAPDSMLVTLNADDLAMQLDKGPAVETADGKIKVVGRKGPGRGYGMVKVHWKHGQRSGKPDHDRITRGDVLALPEVLRTTPTTVIDDEHGDPIRWEWIRKRFDGQPVVYGASRFSAGDDKNHVVTIQVDPMKKATLCATSDLLGRTSWLPDNAISVSASSVGLLRIQYYPEEPEVQGDFFGGTIPNIWRVGE
ncbi:phage portal protein [uncultured Thiodictyon sp.]|uniref:phage portal protein n=1 Tax=uncultured Thiodictyon sp. TaxID=1846217 RepID=UPI0025E1760D|nr:phage portal protein [uncultured Thiodictyon sp.]